MDLRWFEKSKADYQINDKVRKPNPQVKGLVYNIYMACRYYQ